MPMSGLLYSHFCYRWELGWRFKGLHFLWKTSAVSLFKTLIDDDGATWENLDSVDFCMFAFDD